MRQDHVLAQLASLTHEIHTHPHVAVNYLLRAELYAQFGYWDEALTDSQRAYELASNELQGRRWGFVAQAIQDRAHRLILQAKRYKS